MADNGILPWLGAIIPSLGIGGLLGSVVVAWLKRGTDQGANEVQEKNAQTTAVKMSFEIVTESLAELRQELKDEKERGASRDAENKERISTLEGKVTALRAAWSTERQQMLDHMLLLEGLIPQPPGAPERPEFGGFRP